MKSKQLLFVDDDAAFLDMAHTIFQTLSQGAWEIRTAQNHAQALAALQKQRADLVVLDIGMPVVDGVQFLRLLNRAHPGQQVVMLTGHASEAKRKECLENGALLILDKPTEPGGYQSIFAALDALAGAQGGEGFRGMMRRIGLQDVLQMECLGAKSSILDVFTGKVRGRIFIHEGAIVHAESGNVQGEVALYSLLALRGGEFNLHPYTEPPHRTIQGQWEFLLMEAARLQDEARHSGTPATAAPQEAEASESATNPDLPEVDQPSTPVDTAHTRIEEIVLCSGPGDVLYSWQCQSPEARLSLLDQIETQAAQISSAAPVGCLDRLEIHTGGEKIICQIRPDRRLYVRSSGGTL